MSVKGKAVAVGVIAVLAGMSQGHGGPMHAILTDVHNASPGDPRGWPADQLRAAHEPVTRCNVSFLRAWKHGENTAAAFNPLATTQPEPGNTIFNSAGVRNYTSYWQGVHATAVTLHNGLYQPLIADLARGNDPQACANDVTASQWGTKSIPAASC